MLNCAGCVAARTSLSCVCFAVQDVDDAYDDNEHFQNDEEQVATSAFTLCRFCFHSLSLLLSLLPLVLSLFVTSAFTLCRFCFHPLSLLLLLFASSAFTLCRLCFHSLLLSAFTLCSFYFHSLLLLWRLRVLIIWSACSQEEQYRNFKDLYNFAQPERFDESRCSVLRLSGC